MEFLKQRDKIGRVYANRAQNLTSNHVVCLCYATLYLVLFGSPVCLGVLSPDARRRWTVVTTVG